LGGTWEEAGLGVDDVGEILAEGEGGEGEGGVINEGLGGAELGGGLGVGEVGEGGVGGSEGEADGFLGWEGGELGLGEEFLAGEVVFGEGSAGGGEGGKGEEEGKKQEWVRLTLNPLLKRCYGGGRSAFGRENLHENGRSFLGAVARIEEEV